MNSLRACYEGDYSDRIQIVAINDLGSPAINASLLRHDTVHGHFNRKVAIKVFAERNPAKLLWYELDVGLVMECTGLFAKRCDASKHLVQGSNGTGFRPR